MTNFLRTFSAALVAFLLAFSAPALADNAQARQDVLNENLLSAARANDAKKVFELLDLGADISATTYNDGGDTAGADENTYTAAIWLARHGNSDAVYKLATAFPSILEQSSELGYSAAIWLALYGDGQTVLKLAGMLNPAVLEQTNFRGETTSTLLAAQGKVTSVLNAAVINPTVLEHANLHGFTPPVLLANLGHFDGIFNAAVINPAVREQPGIISAAVRLKNIVMVAKLLKDGFAAPNNTDALLKLLAEGF